MTTHAAAAPGKAGRPPAAVLAVRVAVVLIAVAALLSPLYAAMHGLDYLNQPPPPTWGTATGTSGAGSGTGTAGSTGAQTSGGTATSSGFGGC